MFKWLKKRKAFYVLERLLLLEARISDFYETYFYKDRAERAELVLCVVCKIELNEARSFIKEFNIKSRINIINDAEDLASRGRFEEANRLLKLIKVDGIFFELKYESEEEK